MTIKGKLILIMAVTVVGIVAIGASSLIGMNFVRGKLNILTERSTPYQLKTIELQRAVQEHTAELMKMSAVQSAEEFNLVKGNVEKTGQSVKGLSVDLASFTGTGSGGTAELDAITKEMVAVTESRLKAEAEEHKADILMKQKLQQIAQNLRALDASMRKAQAGSMYALSESNEGVKEITKKMRAVEVAGNALSEVKQAVLELAAAESKTSVVVASSKFNTSLRKLTGSEMVKANQAAAKPLLEGAADVKDRVAGADGLIALKNALVAAPTNDKKLKFSQDMPQTMQRLAQMSVVMSDMVEKAAEDFAHEARRFDSSMIGADAASSVLGVSSQLIAEGSEISRLIRDMLSVGSAKELANTEAAMEAAFGRVAQLRAKVEGKKGVKGGGAAAIGGVVASLNEVRGLLLAKGGVADTIEHLLEAKRKSNDLNLKLRELVTAQREEGKRGMSTAQAEQEKAVKSVNSVFRTNVATVSILGLAVLVIGVILSALVLRSISTPIAELSRMAERFGGGDFSGRLDDKRKDEFGKLARYFNAATDKLSEITHSLRDAITVLNSDSSELAKASGDLTAGAARQAQESTQAAAAMTEMTQTIEDVAKNANTAAVESGNALSRANDGRDVVVRTVHGMEQIAASVRSAGEVIESLGGSSAKIGSVINTINEIADQTNLLALNAAIEAARAGEAGMGFAVVADEVRKLAQQTAAATKEIAETIGQIQKDTERSVSAMRVGTEKVEEGIQLANEASNSLAGIVEASTQSGGVVNQIAVAAEEQSAVAVEVSHGVEKIALITRETELAASNISNAASRLNRVAGELDRTASWFKS